MADQSAGKFGCSAATPLGTSDDALQDVGRGRPPRPLLDGFQATVEAVGLSRIGRAAMAHVVSSA